MAINRVQAVKSVTTAGTAEPLSDAPVGFTEVLIQAEFGNTGNVFIGNSDVDSTNGIVLIQGATIEIQGGDLNTIYIDSANNGDGVRLFYKTSNLQR